MSRRWLLVLIPTAIGIGLLSGTLYRIPGVQSSTAQPPRPESPAPPDPSVPPDPTPTPIALATPPSQPLTLDPEQGDPVVQSWVDSYLQDLETQGFSRAGQGVWLQTNDQFLAAHQGTTPLAAASLTKIATTLATLKTLGPEHRFKTVLSTTGSFQDGILQGDLVVQGAGDPFFVWEDAIAVGNALNAAGIRQVTGNLVITGSFSMNFQRDPAAAGALLKSGLNAQLWSTEALAQYQTLPAGTPQPQVVVSGSVQVTATPSSSMPLIEHYSFPVAELLKKMNRFSNNVMADIFADHAGGATQVAQLAAEASGIPLAEVQLINGSGLGLENRISPRAVCAMLLAIEGLLDPYELTVGDLFEIVGQDTGVLVKRILPSPLVAKSGTLNQVSSLAGALSTEQQPVVWFVIMNTGYDLQGFRLKQGSLLQRFVDQWAPAMLAPQLSPNPARAQLHSESLRVP